MYAVRVFLPGDLKVSAFGNMSPFEGCPLMRGFTVNYNYRAFRGNLDVRRLRYKNIIQPFAQIGDISPTVATIVSEIGQLSSRKQSATERLTRLCRLRSRGRTSRLRESFLNAAHTTQCTEIDLKRDGTVVCRSAETQLSTSTEGLHMRDRARDSPTNPFRQSENHTYT